VLVNLALEATAKAAAGFLQVVVYGWLRV